jgi:hypothetical protein
MAKKKTDNKELKEVKTEKEVKKPAKKEIEVPNTKMVRILLYKDNKEHVVGRDLAITLISVNRAELV